MPRLKANLVPSGDQEGCKALSAPSRRVSPVSTSTSHSSGFSLSRSTGCPPTPAVENAIRSPSGDQEGLKAIFKRIDDMQQTELEKVAAETMDYYAPYCVVGLSLLGVSLLSLFGLRYTPW